MSISTMEHISDRDTTNILIGCSGSVATIKLPKLIDNLQRVNDRKVDIRVVMTEMSCHFCDPNLLPVVVYRDKDEWATWTKMGDPVLHIELRRWADILIIAPIDANTLAKISGGICDNLLTCIVRAWDAKKPLLFAPAMNTFMWEHPITNTQIDTLKHYGYHEIPCIAKKLACGDEGYGAMAEVDDIIPYIWSHLPNISR